MKTNTTPTPNMQARVPPGSGTDELSKFWDAARSNQFGTFVRKRPIYERLVALDAGHPNRGQRMTCSAYGDLATLPYHETNALNTQRRPFHLHGNHPRQNLRHGSSTSRTSTFRSSSAPSPISSSGGCNLPIWRRGMRFPRRISRATLSKPAVFDFGFKFRKTISKEIQERIPHPAPL
jgi:hypothetical protein